MISKTTKRFRQMLVKLPNDVRHQAREAYRLFLQNPNHPSLRFKKYMRLNQFIWFVSTSTIEPLVCLTVKRLYGSGLALMGNMISCLTSLGQRNQPLQLMEATFGFSNVNRQTTVFALSHVLLELPPPLKKSGYSGLSMETSETSQKVD